MGTLSSHAAQAWPRPHHPAQQPGQRRPRGGAPQRHFRRPDRESGMSYKFCPRCATPLQTGAVDAGPARLRCPACDFVHWDNPVPVVAAIVEHEGQVILARNRAWPPKMFALITGFLEKDDPDPASGVLREVEEELGLKGRVESFVGHYPFPRMNQ